MAKFVGSARMPIYGLKLAVKKRVCEMRDSLVVYEKKAELIFFQCLRFLSAFLYVFIYLDFGSISMANSLFSTSIWDMSACGFMF